MTITILLIIQTARIYENPIGDKKDGYRILVDRLWPRGLGKDKVKLDFWAKEIAPSHSLRKWFAHDEVKWPEFKLRYLEELKENNKQINLLIEKLQQNDKIMLLYSAKDAKHNNAIVLKDYLLDKKIYS